MKQRLFTARRCYCGSRLWHVFDLDRNGHYAVCHRKQHKTRVDRPWAPTLFDFFCECGGLFFATTNAIAIGGDIEILRDFACPVCANKWRFTGVGANRDGSPRQHDALTLALANATIINRDTMEHRPEITNDLAVLRAYSAGPPVSGFRNFLRNLFKTWPEPLIPPTDMPERNRVLEWSRELRERLDTDIQREIDAGLLVWCDNDQPLE